MIHFDFDKADIRAGDQGMLDRKAAILAANPTCGSGSPATATSVAPTSTTSPWATAARRAAKRYLASKGVDDGRLDVVSYGKERPLNPGHDEDAWAKNRRDEFEVTAGGDNLVAPQ